MKKSKLKKIADDLFSKYIRARDGRCQKCGTDQNLQCAHIFSRGYGQIRYDLQNAVALCRGCHRFFTDRPIEWEFFIKEKIGVPMYENLKVKALKHDKKIDYDEIITELKELDGSLL